MIRGEKVYLRPIVREDLEYLNNWKNNEEIFRYLGGGYMPVSIDIQEKWMDSFMDTTGPNKRFMICNYDDEPVGFIGLYDIHSIHRTCEIGVYLGNENVRGKGYGKEACVLIEDFAKRYLNLRKIKLSVVSENEKALRLWTSLGYSKIGEYKDERYINGEYKNVTLMEKFI